MFNLSEQMVVHFSFEGQSDYFSSSEDAYQDESYETV